jgi:PAS domain S-box-containing protein
MSPPEPHELGLGPVFWTIQEALVVADAAGDRIALWNPAAEALFGWSAEQALGRPAGIFVAGGLAGLPAAAPGAANGSSGADAAGAIRAPARRRDGSPLTIELTLSPLNVRGVAYLLAVIRDVSAREAMEAALRASEERFRLLVEGVRDYAIFMLDPQGRVASWNAGAERIKGYTTAEILGHHLSEFYPPEDAAAGKPAYNLRMAEAQGAIADEGWRVRKDGSRFWASVLITALRDERGQLIGFAKVTRDVTERLRAEQERLELARAQEARSAAEAEQRRLSLLAEASAVLASSLDYHATLARFAALIVPYLADWCTVDLLEGADLVRVAVAHEDPAKVELAREVNRLYPPARGGPTGAQAVARTGQSSLYPEVTDAMLQAAARDAIHLEMLRSLGVRSSISVAVSGREAPLGVLTLVSAESERRYGPHDVALAEDLARRAGMAVENARLYKEAREAVQVREDFLAIASHELKTPLTGLQLQVQMLQQLSRKGQLTTLPPERAQFLLDRAERQIKHLVGLVNLTLDISRAHAAQVELRLAPVDLVDVVRVVAERVNVAGEGAASALVIRAPETLVGQWDRERLEQVVTNLLTNALKYGAGQPVEVTLSSAGPHARLAVRDSGIGVEAEHHDRIFERFERAVSVRNYGGFGLGLYIVRKVVDALGGTVHVDSAAGAGATFTVELPLAGPPARAAGAEAAP